MRRYQDIPVVKNARKKQVTRSVLYPSIPKTPNDIYVLTTAGDRIDLLAHKYYGSIGYWWIIALANGVGNGSVVLEPGTQLRIPANTDAIMAEYRRLNQL